MLNAVINLKPAKECIQYVQTTNSMLTLDTQAKGQE